MQKLFKSFRGKYRYYRHLIVLMRVIGQQDEEQYLEGIEDPEEAASILDAFQLAVDAAPADNPRTQET